MTYHCESEPVDFLYDFFFLGLKLTSLNTLLVACVYENGGLSSTEEKVCWGGGGSRIAYMLAINRDLVKMDLVQVRSAFLSW